MMIQQESIVKQVFDNRKKFRVDHFDIVISEYINRYNSKLLILDPPYQRQFRWDIEKQSALIESILIGIPLPPIFVFSNKNFEWEIIDGLQRTKTLVNFLNSIIDNLKEKTEAQKLTGCSILTELNGKTLDELPQTIVNSIKNYRIRIELVEDIDDVYAQYLLFSRLNNNGEPLSEQELRNFLIYKLNSTFYDVITKRLRNYPSFKNVFNLNDERLEKQVDVEYIVRFFICKNIMLNDTVAIKYHGINDLITSEIQKILINANNHGLSKEYDNFQETHDFLYRITKKQGYKYFNKNVLSLPNASVIGPAISLFLNQYLKLDEKTVINKIKTFYDSDQYKKITSQSYSPTKRFFELSLYAYSYFSNEARGNANNG